MDVDHAGAAPDAPPAWRPRTAAAPAGDRGGGGGRKALARHGSRATGRRLGILEIFAVDAGQHCAKIFAAHALHIRRRVDIPELYRLTPGQTELRQPLAR